MRNLSHGMKETRSRTSRSSTTSSSRPPRASATSPTSGTEGNWKRIGRGNSKLPAFSSKHGSNPTGASPSSSRSPTTSHPPPTPPMRERRTSTKRTTSKLRLLQPKRLINGPMVKQAHVLRSSTWTRSSRPTSSSRPHRKKKGKRWKNTLRSGQKETIPVPSKTSLHWKSPKKLQRTNKRKTLHCPINWGNWPLDPNQTRIRTNRTRTRTRNTLAATSIQEWKTWRTKPNRIGECSIPECSFDCHPPTTRRPLTTCWWRPTWKTWSPKTCCNQFRQRTSYPQAGSVTCTSRDMCMYLRKSPPSSTSSRRGSTATTSSSGDVYMWPAGKLKLSSRQTPPFGSKEPRRWETNAPGSQCWWTAPSSNPSTSKPSTSSRWPKQSGLSKVHRFTSWETELCTTDCFDRWRDSLHMTCHSETVSITRCKTVTPPTTWCSSCSASSDSRESLSIFQPDS